MLAEEFELLAQSREELISEAFGLGPIDYILVEWPGRQPNGEVAPHLVELVDRGLIRILDLAFIAKDEDGTVAGLEIADLGERGCRVRGLRGASSGLLYEDDLAEAGNVLEPGTSAALLVYENTWAAPFATAVRRSGGQLVASGRIPVQDVLAALDAVEADSLGERRARCQDYSEESHEPPSSPGPPPRSATASPAARASAGPSRKNSSATAGPASPSGAPPAPAAESTIDQLKELGDLKSQGILTEEEFAAQKARCSGPRRRINSRRVEEVGDAGGVDNAGRLDPRGRPGRRKAGCRCRGRSAPG